MPFQDFPAEILQEIVASARQPDILNLLLTCRHLREVTEPAFYRSIDNSSYGSFRSQNNVISNRPAYRLLLRTLLNRPELGNHVRRFVVENDPLRHDSTRRMPQFTIDDWNKLGARASTLGLFGNQIHLDQAMAVDKGWIWFPVLLSFFMNLQSLTTSIYVNLATRRESLSPTMRHHMPMVRSIADVSNLVYVDIILDDPLSHPIPWNSPTIISIFRLPRIQTIRMSVGTGNDAYDWPSDLLAPTLTKLYFFHSNLYEDSLKCILASAPNLYDFTLNLVWYDEPTSNLAGGFLDCRKIGEAITTSTCSATLGRVILDVKFEDRHFNTPAKIERDGKMGGPWESGRSPYPGPTFQWGTKGTLGSIKSLRCLTLLMTDLNLQFGWSPKHARHPRDLLPESLRGLVLGTRLAECREFAWKRDVIREWLKEDISLGQLGALERLVVRQSDVQMEPDSVAKEAVFASFCEEKGITFGIEAW